MATLVLSNLREVDVDTMRRERFAKAYAAGRRDFLKMTNAGARRLGSVISELRQEVNTLLARASVGNNPFTVQLLPNFSRQINAAVAETIGNMTGEMRAIMERAFAAGGRVLPGALAAADLPIAFPVIDRNLLTSLEGTMASTITEAGMQLQNRIMQKIRFGAAGLEPASATMRKVGDLLTTSEEVRKGLRRRIGIGYQAETIARTEIGRAYSNAQQAASVEMSQQVPGLKKRWVTSKRVRRGHREAEDAYREGGSIGPIPVKQRFKITDYSRTGSTRFLTLGGRVRPKGFTGGLRVVGVEPYNRSGSLIVDNMLFPRDPAAQPGNVVNCTCVVFDVVPGFEDLQRRSSGAISQGEGPGAIIVTKGRKSARRKPRTKKRRKADKDFRGRFISKTKLAGESKQYKDWIEKASANISDPGYRAVRQFTGGGYMRMVQLQRLGAKKAGITGSELTIVKDRVAALKKWTKDAPVWEGQLFRGIRSLDDKTFRKLINSKTIEWTSFQSTSVSERFVDNWIRGFRNSIKFRIKNGKGVWIEPVSKYRSEKEILQEAGQKFRVLDVKKVGPNSAVINMEEIT